MTHHPLPIALLPHAARAFRPNRLPGGPARRRHTLENRRIIGGGGKDAAPVAIGVSGCVWQPTGQLRRNIMRCVMFAALVATLAVPMQAAETRTVTGEVVEVSCYNRNGGVGDGHAACALKCAQGGADLGILTNEGVLSISGDKADTTELFGFIAQVVQATGDVMEKDGKMWIHVPSIAPASARLGGRPELRRPPPPTSGMAGCSQTSHSVRLPRAPRRRGQCSRRSSAAALRPGS